MEKIVIAKCVECGAKKEVKANEVPEGEMPMCDKCYGVMIADHAELQEDVF